MALLTGGFLSFMVERYLLALAALTHPHNLARRYLVHFGPINFATRYYDEINRFNDKYDDQTHAIKIAQTMAN